MEEKHGRLDRFRDDLKSRLCLGQDALERVVSILTPFFSIDKDEAYPLLKWDELNPTDLLNRLRHSTGKKWQNLKILSRDQFARGDESPDFLSGVRPFYKEPCFILDITTPSFTPREAKLLSSAVSMHVCAGMFKANFIGFMNKHGMFANYNRDLVQVVNRNLLQCLYSLAANTTIGNADKVDRLSQTAGILTQVAPVGELRQHPTTFVVLTA